MAHATYIHLSRRPQLYTLLLSFRSSLLADIESVNYVLTVTSEGLLSFINDYQCLERLIHCRQLLFGIGYITYDLYSVVQLLFGVAASPYFV